MTAPAATLPLRVDLPGLETPPYPRVMVHTTPGRRAWTSNSSGLTMLHAFYEELGWRIPPVAKRTPLCQQLVVQLRFWRHGRGGDVDNLAKSVLDGLTRARVWRDDSQVLVLEAVRMPGRQPPRLLIEIREFVPAEWEERPLA